VTDGREAVALIGGNGAGKAGTLKQAHRGL